MFSDFEMHVTGIPQIAPFFGAGEGNVTFDGPGEDEDFGLEQIQGTARTGTTLEHPLCGTLSYKRPSFTTARSPA
jgi:hypothetical protein